MKVTKLDVIFLIIITALTLFFLFKLHEEFNMETYEVTIYYEPFYDTQDSVFHEIKYMPLSDLGNLKRDVEQNKMISVTEFTLIPASRILAITVYPMVGEE